MMTISFMVLGLILIVYYQDEKQGNMMIYKELSIKNLWFMDEKKEEKRALNAISCKSQNRAFLNLVCNFRWISLVSFQPRDAIKSAFCNSADLNENSTRQATNWRLFIFIRASTFTTTLLVWHRLTKHSQWKIIKIKNAAIFI